MTAISLCYLMIIIIKYSMRYSHNYGCNVLKPFSLKVYYPILSHQVLIITTNLIS